MPVYHFTLHAYRSWRPDHPRGYTLRGFGYQPASKDAANEHDKRAKQPPTTFDRATQRQMLSILKTICTDEEWRLEAAAFDPSHVHVIISWKTFNRWEDVDRRLKNLLSLKLNRANGTPGKRWFVRGRSAPRRVRDAKHFEHLTKRYLPDHPGIFWMRQRNKAE
jgi:REP element-mobilizing transposase RayT